MIIHSKYTNWLAPSILIAGIILASCSGNTNEQTETAVQATEAGTVEVSEVQYNTTGIVLGSIQERQLTGLLKVNGQLDVPPQNQVSISVPYGGILKDTDLLQGMWIKKGQVLGRMEHPDYIDMQQAYLNAIAQLEFMEKEYKRQQELNRESVSAGKTFEKTTAEYKALITTVEGLKQKLSLLNIQADKLVASGIMRSIPLISPISGYVTQVNANIGKFVQSNEVIFEIVDTHHLHAELMVFEKDVPKLKEDQKVKFVLANENKEREAEVHLIGREISSERTVRVHCHLLNEDRELLPGMFLKATIETSGNQTTTLPSEAIVSNNGKNYFFVRVDAESNRQPSEEKENTQAQPTSFTFKAIEVNTGVSDNGFTEIFIPEGFDKNSKNIVLKGAYDLLSKMINTEEGEHDH